MSKKILAMVLSLVMCLSFAACGDDDSSSKKSKNKDSSVSASDDSANEDSKEDDSDEDESKEDESKEDDSKDDESSEDESSEDESSEDESSEDDSKDDESSKSDDSKPAPSADGVVKGTKYEFTPGSNWVTYDEYKAKLKETGVSAVIIQPFGSELAMYNVKDLDVTDGVGVFYTSKPQTMSAYKGHKISEFESTLTSTTKNAYKSAEDANVEYKGTVEVGGAEALKYEATGKLNGIAFTDIRYYIISGSTLYSFVFSVPAGDYSALASDMENVIKSVKFTEE